LIFVRQCIFLPHNVTMYQALIGVDKWIEWIFSIRLTSKKYRRPGYLISNV
jgi:hypothetical protein